MAATYIRSHHSGNSSIDSTNSFEGRSMVPQALAPNHRRHSSFSPLELVKVHAVAKTSEPEPKQSSIYEPAYTAFLDSYGSDEEPASPVEGDDLSSASSARNSSGRMSLSLEAAAEEAEEDDGIDDDLLDELLDEDNCEIMDAVPVRLSFTDKMIQSYNRLEHQVCRAEIVRFFRPGRAKLVRLSRAPGYPVLFKRPASPANTSPETPKEDYVPEKIEVPPRKSSVATGVRRPSLPHLNLRRNSVPWNRTTETPQAESTTQNTGATPLPTPPITPSRKQKLPVSLGLFGSRRQRAPSSPESPNGPTYKQSARPVTVELPPLRQTLVKRVPRAADERAPPLRLPPSPYDDGNDSDASTGSTDMHPNFPAESSPRKFSRNTPAVLRKPVHLRPQSKDHGAEAAAAAASMIWSQA